MKTASPAVAIRSTAGASLYSHDLRRGAAKVSECATDPRSLILRSPRARAVPAVTATSFWFWAGDTWRTILLRFARSRRSRSAYEWARSSVPPL
jgi:hypothetical protein